VAGCSSYWHCCVALKYEARILHSRALAQWSAAAAARCPRRTPAAAAAPATTATRPWMQTRHRRWRRHPARPLSCRCVSLRHVNLRCLVQHAVLSSMSSHPDAHMRRGLWLTVQAAVTLCSAPTIRSRASFEVDAPVFTARRPMTRTTRGGRCASSWRRTPCTSSSPSRARWCCWTARCPSGRPSTPCTSRQVGFSSLPCSVQRRFSTAPLEALDQYCLAGLQVVC
jgi:hypothetical protein